MAANVLETGSEELGTTGVIESGTLMGNKGILLYEFSQNFKPEHIYNIAFEYVSELQNAMYLQSKQTKK